MARPLPGPGVRAQPGLIRRLLRQPHPVLDELRAAHGPMVGLGAGPLRMAVVGDPAAARELFARPVEDFQWGHAFNVIGFVVGPGSMIVSDGDDHARRRSSVKAAFSRRRLNGWIPMIVERTDVAVDTWLAGATDADDVVDLAPLVRTLVLDVVVRALFGSRLADRVDEIEELFRRPGAYLESPAVKQLPHPFPRTARARVRADRRALDAIIDGEIGHRRAHPSGDALDVLEVLVADGALSDAEIRDQVVTLIGAGHDTTAAALSWALWEAPLAPGLWDALGADAEAALGSVGDRTSPPPDHTSLARLAIAERVMRETLRLHPAGALSPRRAVRDLEVGGYRIPKGTMVLWSAHLIGRDPDVWPDPLRFDPDRMFDLDADAKILAETAWVPFGRGARNCIGFALAQMDITLILARLAQRLVVTPTSTAVPHPVGMVVNRPTGGVPARLAPR
ncbi:MAG TPA: cytochrome P450 [Iamia sp.]|nr:cytochrome P450 [Iamia sp.]